VPTATREGLDQLSEFVRCEDAGTAVLDGQTLEAGHDRQTERVRDPDADLVVAGVGGLVAEQDQVERAAGGLLRPDRVDDRAGGRAECSAIQTRRPTAYNTTADGDRGPLPTCRQ
jgi:hypothetical protein